MPDETVVRMRAAARLLPSLLALLMLHWGTASFVPRPPGFVGEPTRDIRVAEPVQPVTVAAAVRTIAVKPRALEKTRSQDADHDASVAVAGTDVFGFRGSPTARRVADAGGGPLLLRAFDARAPPVSAQG